jgi:prepilin-type N-terminal cleavage/methylation domain-containing protein
MKRAVTLIELIIAMVLMAVLMLAAVTFDVTSRRLLQSSERKTAVLNDLTFAAEAIQKSSYNGNGTASDYGIYPNPGVAAGTGNRICFRSGAVTWDAYYLTGTNLIYCDNYNVAGSSCGSAPETLSSRVTGFAVINPGNVFPFALTVSLTGRYNTAIGMDNATNPQVIINTTVFPGQQSFQDG